MLKSTTAIDDLARALLASPQSSDDSPHDVFGYGGYSGVAFRLLNERRLVAFNNSSPWRKEE